MQVLIQHNTGVHTVQIQGFIQYKYKGSCSTLGGSIHCNELIMLGFITYDKCLRVGLHTKENVEIVRIRKSLRWFIQTLLRKSEVKINPA